MASIDELTQRVNDLTTLVNGIINNSKKITNLTLQSPLDTSSEIVVSGDKKINVQQILDELSGKTIVSKSVDYTASIEEVILVSCSTVDITIDLPTAVGNSGKEIVIIKADDTIYNCIIDADGTETINRELTLTLTNQDDSVTLISNGSNWNII